MAISFYAEKVKVPNFRRRTVSEWIRTVAQHYGKQVGDVAYQFCDDETILDFNRKYLQHDYYTDIITFDQSVEDMLFADIIISTETVHTNAQEYQRPYEEELLRVIIHGILHTCGLNDHTEQEQQAMRAAEQHALELLPANKQELWRK